LQDLLAAKKLGEDAIKYADLQKRSKKHGSRELGFKRELSF
jgi:hypothetical protein